MNWKLVALLMWPVVAGAACREGYMPSDVPGVCQQKTGGDLNPWVSDEKPPTDKMPSWQREGITLCEKECPSKATQDENDDKKKAEAIKQGKKAAGIR